MLICVSFYDMVFPFVAQAKEFLMIYKGVSNTSDAENMAMIILALSGFGVAPCVGLLISKVSLNASFVLLGCVLVTGGHFILWSNFVINPMAVCIVMGLGYSVVAGGLWPLLNYNVRQEISSTCYGIMQSLQLLGLFISYRVSGMIMDSNIDKEKDLKPVDDTVQEKLREERLDAKRRANYANLELYMMASGCVSIFLTIVLIMNKGLHGYKRKKE